MEASPPPYTEVDDKQEVAGATALPDSRPPPYENIACEDNQSDQASSWDWPASSCDRPASSSKEHHESSDINKRGDCENTDEVLLENPDSDDQPLLIAPTPRIRRTRRQNVKKTKRLNLTSAILFVLGLVCLIVSVTTAHWVDGVDRLEGTFINGTRYDVVVTLNSGLWKKCTNGICEPNSDWNWLQGWFMSSLFIYIIAGILNLFALKYTKTRAFVQFASFGYILFILNCVSTLFSIGFIANSPPKSNLSWSYAIAVIVGVMAVMKHILLILSNEEYKKNKRVRRQTAIASAPTDIVMSDRAHSSVV